jgi:AcrR family transcriptional regulator
MIESMATRKRATRTKADGASNGPPRERRNREAEVIDAALHVFSKKGYSAASIQDVADAVGVLKGSLYYYIDSKEDLLFRIFDESHRQASVIADEITTDTDTPPLQRLQTFFERYTRWYLDNFERVSLYFREWRYLTGERRETVLAQRRAWERLVSSLIKEAKSRGDVGDDVDVKYATFFALGSVNSIPEWYRPSGRDSATRIAREYATMIVRSLGPKQG